MEIKEIAITKIKPYEKNPRNNIESVEAVSKSIKSFGFKVPVVIDQNNVIVCGHTRYLAAQKLGIEKVPCIIAEDLTAEQVKAFRLADNKVGELSKWDNALLAVEIEELTALNIDMAEFTFDTSEIWKRHQAWKKAEKFCDLKKKIKCHSHGGFFTTCFFETGKHGEPIAEIKENPANVEIFADCLVDFVYGSLGNNLNKGDWCIVTTPRRRHRAGFHFATEISKVAAEMLKVPFYEGVFSAENRMRINPEFHMEKNIEERNVILFDDVISTGETIRTCRELLIEAGRIVFAIIGIKN